MTFTQFDIHHPDAIPQDPEEPEAPPDPFDFGSTDDVYSRLLIILYLNIV